MVPVDLRIQDDRIRSFVDRRQTENEVRDRVFRANFVDYFQHASRRSRPDGVGRHSRVRAAVVVRQLGQFQRRKVIRIRTRLLVVWKITDGNPIKCHSCIPIGIVRVDRAHIIIISSPPDKIC